MTAACNLSAYLEARAIVAPLLLVVATVIGCGGADDRRSISGMVTWGGEPLPTGDITLAPREVGHASGVAIENGEFEIPSSRGLAPGIYRVEIVAYLPTGRQLADPEAPGHMVDETRQMIPARYNVESELEAEVTANDDNFFEFKLDKR